METLIKEFAEKIKLYFDTDNMSAFIKLKSKYENKGYGVVLSGFISNYFKGYEITNPEVIITKIRLVEALLKFKCPQNDLEGVAWRQNKESEWSEYKGEYVPETDEEYKNRLIFDCWVSPFEIDKYLSLPTWSEYKQTEEFLKTILLRKKKKL